MKHIKQNIQKKTYKNVNSSIKLQISIKYLQKKKL